MAMHLEGVHVALLTPFAPDGSVDEAGLAALVEDQLEAGLRGLVVAGGTGEGLLLTEPEADHVLEVTLATARNRVPVTAHIGALSTAAAVRNATRALAAGAHIGMLQAPWDAPIGEAELVRHVAAVAEVGLPLMIYNNVSTGVELSTELVARLADLEGVDYLKDSSADAARMVDITRRTEGGLQLLLGKDSFALFGFLSGAQATVLGSPNAVPHACVRLQELVARGELDAAHALWDALSPFLAFIETQGYVPAVKAAAELRGLAVGAPRLPTLPLDDARRAELEGLLRRVEAATAPAPVGA